MHISTSANRQTLQSIKGCSVFVTVDQALSNEKLIPENYFSWTIARWQLLC